MFKIFADRTHIAEKEELKNLSLINKNSITFEFIEVNRLLV
ncbi:hypothetical protein JBKA6_1450 [Ichthyobacterium seriolicida]|uniref:Uncharacterized protein n=1 Tax=Ichthyobacterium seriolicida TaxID=242600 RepID=A0A1J1DZV3_9FLAO|nr:hypothetical protein JBKA6_1450 [Ichthyobacterium seriolicida]